MRPSGEVSSHSLYRERAYQEAGIKRRVRARQACEACRRRRRKCDGKHPCAQCTRYDYLCEYANGRYEEHVNAAVSRAVQGQKASESILSPDSGQSYIPDVSSKGVENGQQPSAGINSNEQEDNGRDDQLPPVRSAVDAEKGRFSNAHSGVLFPRRVGHALDLPSRVRFQSYGWNLDVRPEPTSPPLPTIRSSLTYRDLSRYSRTYFDVVNPVYCLLKQEEFLQRCAEYWITESDLVDDIEAVIAGVAALGSFFSIEPLSNEGRLVEHAKLVLDVGCTCAPARTSLNQTVGWILRTLYLRLTTRPLLSWYASCSAVHIAEANGLHVDLQKVDVIGATHLAPPYLASRTDILNCSLFLNALISAEYGRSRVILRDVIESNTQMPSALKELNTVLICLESDITSAKRLELLLSLDTLANQPCLLALLKADVAVHLFRTHLHLHKESISIEERKVLLSILSIGLAQTQSLISLKQPWWNILSTPFQCLMVFIAMDIDKSLLMVQDAMRILEMVHDAFPTHLAGEVIQIAKTLIEGLENRKLRQAKLLSKAIAQDQDVVQNQDYTGFSSATEQILNTSEAVLSDWLKGDMFGTWNPDLDVFQQPDRTLDPFNFP